MSCIALVISSWFTARLLICEACSSNFCLVIMTSCFDPNPNIDAPNEPNASNGDFCVTAPPNKNSGTNEITADRLDLYLVMFDARSLRLRLNTLRC